ncbi:MAG: hypothetical protein WKF78_09265 [Candidatus Limnocylindrales bacterium]
MTDLLRTPAGWPSILLARNDGTAPAVPTDLDAAVAAGAFEGLRRAIRDLGPIATIALIDASGLRGRGGAGFPAGRKWRTAAATEAPRRYVVANGYGADPASHTDRALLMHNPWAVLEGIAIAAIAIDASEAFLAVRAEDSGLLARVSAAVGSATEAGFLGPDVLGSGQGVLLTVRPVQGAYMLGEETVLLKALEGKRGQPEQRPPHPAERGLDGMPTLVQQRPDPGRRPVDRPAKAPRRSGPPAAPDSPGTVLVQVRTSTGQGIAEVPLGTPLRDVLALGDGSSADRPLKAVLVGGPSGGLLPPDALDTAYDFASLRAAGAHLGSGSSWPWKMARTSSNSSAC